MAWPKARSNPPNEKKKKKQNEHVDRSVRRTTDAKADDVDIDKTRKKRVRVHAMATWHVGIACLAWTVVLAVGAMQHRHEDASAPPSTPLQGFDVWLRRMGPAMPWMPFLVRVATQASSRAEGGHETGDTHLQVGENVVVAAAYLFATVLRWIVYQLVRGCKCTSDHVFLAMSLSAMLVVEIALVLDQRTKQHAPQTHLSTHVSWMYLCLLQSAVLLVLLYGDMYYTARYFHSPEDIGISYSMGMICFMIPMGVFLRWTLARRTERSGSSGR